MSSFLRPSGAAVKNYEKVEKLAEDSGWKYLLAVAEMGHGLEALSRNLVSL